MGDVVREMHTRSGLLPAIEASTITLDEAGAATLAFIREHVPDARTVPLCGNSIGTDRRFLAAYLPEIEDYLHYRSVDVSTHQGAGPALVPRRSSTAAPRKATAPPGARRHPRERRTSCGGTATTCSPARRHTGTAVVADGRARSGAPGPFRPAHTISAVDRTYIRANSCANWLTHPGPAWWPIPRGKVDPPHAGNIPPMPHGPGRTDQDR